LRNIFSLSLYNALINRN